MNRKPSPIVKAYVSIILLLALFSCGNHDETSFPIQPSNTDSLQNLNAGLAKIEQEEADKAKWITSNTIPRNEFLLNFYVRGMTSEEREDCSHRKGKISIVDLHDSTIVTFCKRTLDECGVVGNISLEKDTIKLLYNDLCTPYDRPLKGAGYMYFWYVIKNTSKTTGKVYKYEERSLLKSLSINK